MFIKYCGFYINCPWKLKNGYEPDKKFHKMASSELNFQRLHHTTFGQESNPHYIYEFTILANNAALANWLIIWEK